MDAESLVKYLRGVFDKFLAFLYDKPHILL